MFGWLFGKREPGTKGVNPSATVDHLLQQLPDEAKRKMAALRSSLSSLTITPSEAAQKELDARNASRTAVWGDRAASIPVCSGSCDEVLADVLTCLVGDYRRATVSNLAVEQVAQLGAQSGTTARLEELSPGARAKFEKKLAKHSRKERGSDATQTTYRKIVVTAYFSQTFGRHEFLRVGDNHYYSMRCTLAA